MNISLELFTNNNKKEIIVSLYEIMDDYMYKGMSVYEIV